MEKYGNSFNTTILFVCKPLLCLLPAIFIATNILVILGAKYLFLAQSQNRPINKSDPEITIQKTQTCKRYFHKDSIYKNI